MAVSPAQKLTRCLKTWHYLRDFWERPKNGKPAAGLNESQPPDTNKINRSNYLATKLLQKTELRLPEDRERLEVNEL
jgi:hypothetical protein